MIDPKLLCDQHLLGEHSEIHKHRHVFVKRQSISGRVKNKQIEPKAMKSRHDELMIEMILRGMNHNSPYEMPNITYLSNEERNCKVDMEFNILDLGSRCEDCRKRMEDF